MNDPRNPLGRKLIQKNKMDNFDKWFIFLWGLSMLIGVAFAGAVIWAVIELVQWVTTK